MKNTKSKLTAMAVVGLTVLAATSRSEAAVTAFTGPTSILNINAMQSGINPVSFSAGSTLIAPLQESFPAGTYVGTIVTPVTNPTTALYTAWSYNSGTPLSPTYTEDLSAVNDNGGAPLTASPIFYYGSTSVYLTAAQAYTDSIGRTFTFTLAAPATLDFFVPDNALSDNAGGVSVSITKSPAVPEPVSLGLIAAAAPLVFGRRRRMI